MALSPGRHKGKIKSYGFNQPKDPTKNPSAFVEFEVETKDLQRNQVGGMTEVIKKDSIRWTGSFNGGARQYTVKALVEVFGFAGKTGSELLRGSTVDEFLAARKFF